MPGMPPDGPPQPQGPPGVLELPPELLDQAPPIAEPPQPQATREAPTEEEVRDRIDRVKEFWSERDARMQEDHQLYRLATELAGIEEYEAGGEVVIRNLPYVTVEKLANMIAAETPLLSVLAPAPEATEAAERVEDLCRQMREEWARAHRRSVRGTLAREEAHFALLRGWVAARVEYLEDAGPGEVAVAYTLVDPINVYPMPGSRGIRYVAHVQRITLGELYELFPEAEAEFADEERDETDTVELRSYYDDWWYATMADDKVLVPPTAHEYGFVPWAIAIAGGAPIRSTAEDDDSWVADVGPSIFHGLRRTFRSANRVYSQLATEIARMGNPAKLYYYDPDNNEAPQEIDLSPGATNFLMAPREKVEVIRTSPNPADVAPLLQALSEDLQRASLPGVLWGVAGPEISGFAVSLLSGAARDAVAGVLAALEQLHEDVYEMALKLLARFHTEPLGVAVTDRSGRWVAAAAVTPETLKQVGHRVRVRFREFSPRDRMAMAQLGAQLAQGKLISMRTARERYLDLENPDAENDRIVEELIYQDDELMREYLVPLALARHDPELFQVWLAREGRRLRLEQQAAQAPPAGPEGTGLPGPPMEGMPPGPVPPPFGPGFDAQAQAEGATAGAAGMEGPLPPNPLGP